MLQAATATSNHPTKPGSPHSTNADASTRLETEASADLANTASAPNHRRALTRASDRRALSNLRTRTERGAATAEYAITIVGACAIGGLLVSLLKSPAMQNALKSIINFGLKMAGVEGVHL